MEGRRPRGYCTGGGVWIATEDSWSENETSGSDSTSSNSTPHSGTWGFVIMMMVIDLFNAIF